MPGKQLQSLMGHLRVIVDTSTPVGSAAATVCLTYRVPLPCRFQTCRQQAQQLTQQQLLIQEWQGFASCQVQRHVPAPPSANRRILPQSVCYRLRVLRVDNVPAPQHTSGIQYGLQLGVTLYDEALGQFYGNTCYSMVEPLQDLQQQEQGQGQEQPPAVSREQPSVDFSCDVMFHSVISDPHCMAVVSRLFCPPGPCTAWL
jgi:hypothetical protein